MDVNSDTPQKDNNIQHHDPRNPYLKKHMVQLAIYELCKIIAPNNVNVIWVNDYQASMKRLNDAGKLKLNSGK